MSGRENPRQAERDRPARGAAEPVSLGLPRQRAAADVETSIADMEAEMVAMVRVSEAHDRHQVADGLPVQRQAPRAAQATRVDLDRPNVARSWLRRHGLKIEMLVSVVTGLAVAAGFRADLPVLAVVLAIWGVTAFHSGRAVTSPLALQLRNVASSTLPALAFAGAAVGFLGSSEALVRHSFPAVLSAALVSTVFRSMRWRLQSPMRVLAVGDRVGVAQAVERFRSATGSEMVGAVVVEADINESDVSSELIGVPCELGLDRVAVTAASQRADLVVVTPGPGFTSTDLKCLQHTLEHAPVAVGVLGVLDSVAPHRIRPGWVANATILDVRSPRPSAWVRLVKATTDRLVAAVALIALAPVLLSLMALVRLDSRGPALFVQRRVGRRGAEFPLIKLRTMVVDAEDVKHRLSPDAGGDDLLFKVRADPRITRVGRVLRRYSLDELPQLWNVLRGQMSLVGPRPFLPDEIAKMDPSALRRIDVAPGLTGLWQVSGRSDLGWDESAWLDVYYADNWSLLGDLKIIARTVPAVLGAKGAY